MGHLTILPSEQPLSERIKSTAAAAAATTATSPPSKHSREYGCNIFRLYVKSMCWAGCQDNEAPLSWQRRRCTDASDALLRRHNLPHHLAKSRTMSDQAVLSHSLFSLLFRPDLIILFILLRNAIWCDCKQTRKFLSLLRIDVYMICSL